MQQWQRRAERKRGPGDPHPSQGVTWEALVRGSGGRGRAGGSGRAGTAGCRKREAAEGRHAMQPCTGLGQAVQHAETPPTQQSRDPPTPPYKQGDPGLSPTPRWPPQPPARHGAQAAGPCMGALPAAPMGTGTACRARGHQDSGRGLCRAVPGSGSHGAEARSPRRPRAAGTLRAAPRRASPQQQLYKNPVPKATAPQAGGTAHNHGNGSPLPREAGARRGDVPNPPPRAAPRLSPCCCA